MELYRTWRPVGFTEVFGQDQAVTMLREYLATNSVPHAVLFTGQTGGGKTTLARILWDKLLCREHGVKHLDETGKDPKVLNAGYREINAAESRGIDTIREIAQEMPMGHVGGRLRGYVLDECHKLTSDAQTALLKVLEDGPKHVYFFLCSTDPAKVLTTVKSRCTEVKVKSLGTPDLMVVLNDVIVKAGIKNVEDPVKLRICGSANGSARQAIQLLELVSKLPTRDAQMEALEESGPSRAAFDLVKMLLWEGKKYPEVHELLKALKEQDVEIEPLRWAMLTCAFSEMGKGDRKAGWASLIIEEFSKPFFDSKWAGVASACFNVLRLREKR